MHVCFMTHEFKKIYQQAVLAKKNQLKTVLASVVALDGSSYRRPGVRMLIIEGGKMIGAVSGGCVEKEILIQAEAVFKTGVSKMMTYDGRYRLGCEGVLYILLERFAPNDSFQAVFENCLDQRAHFEIHSYYEKAVGKVVDIGSWIKINNENFSLQGEYSKVKIQNECAVFKQKMAPCFKLIIIGAEHDAVQLCQYAALTGWEVTIIASPSQPKSIANFPGANTFSAVAPEALDVSKIDAQTAVVLMTHNFAKDVRFMVALKDTYPKYIGVLGPAKRREDLFSELIAYCPDIDATFLDIIHGPAGIDIGSETPQEIAIAIVAEILSVDRKRETISLSKKNGSIHSL